MARGAIINGSTSRPGPLALWAFLSSAGAHGGSAGTARLARRGSCRAENAPVRSVALSARGARAGPRTGPIGGATLLISSYADGRVL